MNPKQERIIVTAVLILFLVGAYVLYDLFTFKRSHIKEAKQLLKEYKIAKALNILEKTKLRVRGKDTHLDMLILYSLTKANKFDQLTKQLESIDHIPRDYEDKFLEIVEILNINDKTDLIVKLIAKASKLKLREDFFINTSQSRNSVNEEINILSHGLKYLRELRDSQSKKKKKKKQEISTRKLEDYTLRRCIEIANIYIGAKDYKTALSYLNKAQALKVLHNPAIKDDFYLNLALTHKSLNNFSKAWDNMQLSAQLGNERAKSMLQALNRNFVPKE